MYDVKDVSNSRRGPYLEDVGFLLEEKNDLIPHQLFSKVDMGIGFDVMQLLNAHAHPTTCFSKEVRQVFPSIDHNKWTICKTTNYGYFTAWLWKNHNHRNMKS
jgi:hypothetical protein